MRGGDTIAAVATGGGRSRRAIIRLSGPGLPDLLAHLLTPPDPPPGVSAARLRLTPALELPLLVMRSAAGRSYTGEESAELIVPGNPHLLARIMALLVSHEGVREATPGEFSARAFLSGRLTLAQAEGVAAMIAARTDEQLAAAARLISGATGERYKAWADEAATLQALVEAGIDFTDQEDVVPIPPAELARRLDALTAEITEALGSTRGAEAPSHLPMVVLAGEPNAGKSTLFNALLGRRRSVVSDQRGTTRDVIAEPLDLSRDVPGGPTIMLADLAGLDADAAGMIDEQAQRRAIDAIAAADVVVHCDPTGRFAPLPPPRDGRADRTVIRVRTKADLPTAPGPASAEDLAVCAVDGYNLGPLRRAIADAAWGGSVAASEAALLPRHRRALAQAAHHLAEARALASGSTAHPELTAGALRAALDHLGELTGEVSPDDVIGRIFATFCVGK